MPKGVCVLVFNYDVSSMCYRTAADVLVYACLCVELQSIQNEKRIWSILFNRIRSVWLVIIYKSPIADCWSTFSLMNTAVRYSSKVSADDKRRRENEPFFFLCGVLRRTIFAQYSLVCDYITICVCGL